MNTFTVILICLIFTLIEYFTVPLYIKLNKDLFWALYYKDIIKELKERCDSNE